MPLQKKLTLSAISPQEQVHHLNSPIALTLVNTKYTTVGDSIYADVRGRFITMTLVSTPFVPANYHRKSITSVLTFGCMAQSRLAVVHHKEGLRSCSGATSSKSDTVRGY